MLRLLAVVAAPLLLSSSAWAQAPKELVGKYQMEVEGGDVLELRADGTASMAGEETRWSAKGAQLSIGPDTIPYSLAGGRLLLTMGSVQMAWKRLGAAGKGPSPLQKAAAKAKAATPEVSEDEADREALEQAKAWLAQNGNGPQAGALPQQPGGGQPMAPGPSPRPGSPVAAGRQPPRAPGGGNPQDAEARRNLMSTAWCSFTYNQHSGTSTKRRVVFRQDGTMTINGGAETYNSGPAGTVAGQSSNAETMQWKFENLRLYVDAGDGAGFQDIGLTAERNSNGSPILKAGGREYMVCN